MAVTADSLFQELFLPLYPSDARENLARARSTDANPANNPTVLAHLDEAAQKFTENAASAFGDYTGGTAADLGLDYSDASIHRLSAALTAAQRDRLLGMGARGTADNALFNVIVHGAAYVGASVVRTHDGVWTVRRPLWESRVILESRAGTGELAVFHWWLKSLSDEALAGGVTLADRYRTHVEVPCARPDDLPVIAAADRRLPRLARPRYDALYKYLRAHLPELRDVGEHFPSPERFEELKLAHISFVLVGGGRMLVAFGPGEHGLHAFWLTKEGFEKSAFWPCDAFPDPIVRAKGEDKLEIVLAQNGAPRSFELLWWGP